VAAHFDPDDTVAGVVGQCALLGGEYVEAVVFAGWETAFVVVAPCPIPLVGLDDTGLKREGQPDVTWDSVVAEGGKALPGVAPAGYTEGGDDEAGSFFVVKHAHVKCSL